MKQKGKKGLEELKKTLKENEAILKEKFKVRELGIFGSYVRGEQKEKSDVDMFVEFNEPVSLLHLVELENFLTDLIGIKADIGTKNSIKPRIKEQVLKEAIIIPMHEKNDMNCQKERIMEKLDKAEEELNESGQSAVSITDPEARFMKNKKERIELSYNPQITADHDSGIIVANDATQDCTDHAQLEPQVNSTMENVGELPEGAKMSFDNGYFSGANLRYLEEMGLDAYITDSKQAQEQKGNKPKMSPFSKDSFYYDEDKDQFLCPNGEIISRKGEYEYNGKPVYAYYGANCAESPVRSECAGEGKIRKITSDGYEGERRRMVAKMRSETGKEGYKKRKETVEWPFGNIKQNMKFREFLTRGIEKVRVEHNLACTAHNLKVIWGKLERNVPVIDTIRTLVANSASKLGNFLRVHTIVNFKCHC